MRKKKIAAALACLSILSAGSLSACGKEIDDQGRTLISSEWKPVEFTVRGTTTEYNPLYFWEKGKFPEFECDDGSTCTMTVNGKSHTGTVTEEEDGTYTIVFGDSDRHLIGVIDDDVLTITTDNDAVSFVFETT